MLILVLAELILISCPFLVIFLYVERGNEAHHPSAVLARRTITVFTLVFTVLILVQGCIASVGFAKLCKSVLETGRDKCDAKIGFWDTIRPCDKYVSNFPRTFILFITSKHRAQIGQADPA